MLLATMPPVSHGVQRQRVLGQGACLDRRGHHDVPDHLVAHRDVVDAGTDGFHDTGGVTPPHQWVLVRQHLRQPPGGHGVVERVESCRRPDPADGRSTLAVLTDAGWEKVVETAPGKEAEVRRLVFDQLTTAQVRQLHAIGSRVLLAIGSEGLAPRRT